MARTGQRYRDQRVEEFQANFATDARIIARNPNNFRKKISMDEETTLLVTPTGNPSGSSLRIEIEHTPIPYKRASPFAYDHSSEDRTTQLIRENLEGPTSLSPRHQKPTFSVSSRDTTPLFPLEFPSPPVHPLPPKLPSYPSQLPQTPHRIESPPQNPTAAEFYKNPPGYRKPSALSPKLIKSSPPEPRPTTRAGITSGLVEINFSDYLYHMIRTCCNV